MTYSTLTRTPISDAARFFRLNKDTIRFEEKPDRFLQHRQAELEKNRRQKQLAAI